LFLGQGEEVTTYEEAAKGRAAPELHQLFKDACFRRGVYLDVNWHGGFSCQHSDADLDRVVEVFADACDELVAARPRDGHFS